MKEKNFNLVISGVGGQGQVTLLRILSEAALIEGKDVKTAETHGLAQRGGAVEVHFRMGKVFSPLVFQAGADLILSLELQETLRAMYYCSEKTQVLANEKIINIPGEKTLSKDEALKEIKKFTKNFEIINASEVCQQKLGNEVLAGIFMLGLAVNKKLIPLKKESFTEAIKRIVPEKYLDLNLKAFNLTF